MVAYWLDLFTLTTWQEFLDAGGNVSGFRESQSAAVNRMQPGDHLLCYLTGVSRFIGVLEVVSEPYIDRSRSVWQSGDFPCRVNVRIVSQLAVEAAIPIKKLSDRLSIFRNLKSPDSWTGHVRSSPKKWSAEDGEIVIDAIREALINPVIEPMPPRKLRRRPKTHHTNQLGQVTIPDSDETTLVKAGDGQQEDETGLEQTKAASAHSEIQWLLLKLGNDMGLDVWAARNDRGREYNGHRFESLPRMRSDLPLQFHEATKRTIELIDVLWLSKNSIVAAFEIESTTSIYSGLLRMADLLAMQPNINIPLYLVAPDERRSKVLSEVNRPTFSRLSPPLKQICRYLAFSTVRDDLPPDPRTVEYLAPTFLERFTEFCDLEGT